MEAAGEEACPPSVAFAVGDRHAFAMNVAPGSFDLTVRSSRVTTRFGFLTKKQSLDWEIMGVGADVVAGLVEKIFVEVDEEWIAFADSLPASFP